MLKCIIVDDESLSIEELKFFVTKNEAISLEKEFQNPVEALKYLEKNSVDIVFLDINMPQLDGVSFGKILNKMNNNIEIVYITAHRDFAVDAFEIKAFDYILKPYSDERINEVLGSLVDELEKGNNLNNVNPHQKVTVTLENKMYVISLDEISYIEVSEKESIVFSHNKKYTSKLKISQWEKLLPKEKFYKTHRAFIINLDMINEIEPWFNSTYIVKIKNNNETKIPVSRSNVREFKEMFMIK